MHSTRACSTVWCTGTGTVSDPRCLSIQCEIFCSKLTLIFAFLEIQRFSTTTSVRHLMSLPMSVSFELPYVSLDSFRRIGRLTCTPLRTVTHQITFATSKLVYMSESGALNEAYVTAHTFRGSEVLTCLYVLIPQVVLTTQHQRHLRVDCRADRPAHVAKKGVADRRRHTPRPLPGAAEYGEPTRHVRPRSLRPEVPRGRRQYVTCSKSLTNSAFGALGSLFCLLLHGSAFLRAHGRGRGPSRVAS
jgi:hypothetical protein